MAQELRNGAGEALLTCTGLLSAETNPRQLRHVQLGWRVEASGPPGVSRQEDLGEYKPRFWIAGDGEAVADLEPLVVSWKAGGQHVYMLNQDIAMTYGLSPRTTPLGSETGLVWDDSGRPLDGVAAAQPKISDRFDANGRAFVSMLADYVADYASLRGQAIVECYFTEGRSPPSPAITQALGNRRQIRIKKPGCMLEIRLMEDSPPIVYAAAWGHRVVALPGKSPVTVGTWQYGRLQWPGIKRCISSRRDLPLMDYVYVRDSVLDAYEKDDRYDIHPGLGAVSYNHQWSVSHCGRLGRDLIRVELRKLYEGAPPDVVRHWHKHAVEPPKIQYADLAKEPNIASRAKRICLLLAGLLSSLENLRAMIGIAGPAYMPPVTIEEIQYKGWWQIPHADEIAAHAPRNMTVQEFLARCGRLHVFCVENLPEARLRTALDRIRAPKQITGKLGSIGLLSSLLEIVSTANETGMGVRQVAPRLKEGGTTHVPHLHCLNLLRQLASHRRGKEWVKKLDKGLQMIALTRPADGRDYGIVLDSVYDGVIGEMQNSITTLSLVAPRPRR